MKRNYLIALTLFAAFLLCTRFQLWAELTLQQAEKAVESADGKLGNANTHLVPTHTEMWVIYGLWTENEEELNRDNLLATSTARDPAALAALGLIHAADISDKLRLSRELAGKISTFNTKQKAVNDAADELQTAWDTYWEHAKYLSRGERYVIKNTPLSLSPPSASLTCPACGVTYSGENLGGIGDHVTLCDENEHSVSPYPYFSCESSGCPLSNEHHTFPCRGKCGDMFQQPTILSPPPASQGAGGFTKIYHDHGYACDVDVSGFGNCPETAYTCKTPECSNDANHLKDGECGRHKIRKGDTAAVAEHQRVGQSCPETYTYPSGNTISCVIYIGYKCDEHSFHDYDPGSGTNPPPESFNNGITYACSTHSGPSSGSSSHSLQASCTSTDSNGNSCTVTNFYACDSHTHSYPSPPTTVACGAAGWTGCTVRSSDGNACRVDPCDSGCGSSYWSCSTSGVSWHKTSRTCKRANCGASYTNCTRGNGTCSNGAYIWHKK